MAHLLLVVSLLTQADSSARIMGYAKSAFNGRPLAGVMISVPAAHKFVVTDSSGTFLLADLPTGKQKVLVSYHERATDEYQFALKRGKTKRLAIVLDVDAVDLNPVIVEVQGRGHWMDLAGFFDRRKAYSGFARFFTREDLETRRARTIADVLRREGIYDRCLGGTCGPARVYRGTLCAVPIFVDGMPYWSAEYDMIPMDLVNGIEIYRPGMDPPGLFNPPPRANSFAAESRDRSFCGSVNIWTRRLEPLNVESK